MEWEDGVREEELTDQYLSYPVHASEVTKEFTLDPNKARTVYGTYKIVAPIFSPEPLRLTEERRFKIPLVAELIQDHEKQLFPPENHATDGTILINIDFTPQNSIIEGVAPQINIVRPNPVIVPQDHKDIIDASERIAFIKEASSLLLSDILEEQTYLKMEELGLPIYAEVRKANGEVVEVEMAGCWQL